MISVRKSSKNCAVCRAPASSQNLGAATCEACKSFFRRSFINDVYRSYQCTSGGNCKTDVFERNLCMSCRFQRCVKAHTKDGKNRNLQGNNSGHVAQVVPRIETRQREMDEAAQELMQELLSLTSCHVPTVNDKGKFFSMMEIFDLDSLSSKYVRSFHNVNVRQEALIAASQTPFDKMVGCIVVLLKRLVFFAKSLAEFADLDFKDRETLFRGACAELCMINTVLTFDNDSRVWVAAVNNISNFYKNVPVVTCQHMSDILGQDLHKERERITIDLQKYHPDETVVMLLYAILLFNPSRTSLASVKSVQKSQMHFALLLRKYLRWQFGEKEGDRVFVSTVKILKEFRRISPTVYQKIHSPFLESNSNEYLKNNS